MTIVSPVQRDPLDPVGASLFEASEDCVKLVGLDGRLEGMNVNGICLMEIDDFESLRGQPWASLWPELEQAKISAAVAHAAGGHVARFSADCPTAKGTLKAWDVLVSPVFDESGQVARLVSISRDVTHTVRIEQENALLVRELAHRIKNMFAVVDGVISLSARAATEGMQPFASALRERILGLGRAIAYVTPAACYAPDHGDQTLQGLLHVLLRPYGDLDGGARRIAVHGDDVPIGRAATTSVALFVNELATNALKYGALRAPGGTVAVDIRRTDTGFDLLWREDTAGMARAAGDKAAEGFGTTLMDNAVRRQLGGTLVRTWEPGGLAVAISLPAARLAL